MARVRRCPPFDARNPDHQSEPWPGWRTVDTTTATILVSDAEQRTKLGFARILATVSPRSTRPPVRIEDGGQLKIFHPGWLTVLAGPGLLVAPSMLAVAHAAPLAVEPDVRTIPWDTVRRFALEAGLFPPVYRPRSEAELAELLTAVEEQARSGAARGFVNEDELARLDWWSTRYRDGGGGKTWARGEPQGPRLRLSGRAVAGFTDLGTPVDLEAGLAWSPGWNATFEPIVDVSAGRWWASITARISGRVAAAGVAFSEDDRAPLTWPDWSIPTGKSQVRDARLQGDEWSVDVPRLVAGVTLGNWGLSAGWVPRRTGTAVTGAMTMDYTGVAFPSLYARRTRPFHADSRFLDLLAPEDLMLSAGRLSARTVRYRDEDDVLHLKTDEPWFFQWLVGWQITSWFRVTLIHAAMASPREGSLWGDIFQIAFPTPGVTDSETTHGPVTDRIFAVQYEVRWRNAPWPILPAAGGRIFIDWGAEDYRGRGPDGLIPRIAAPGGVGGVELVGPVWDLLLEYSELVHSSVLWYSNAGFPEGYSQEGWLLGNALGGSAESVTGIVRLRPDGWGVEMGLRLRRSTWGMDPVTPGDGSMNTVAWSIGKLPGITPSAADVFAPRTVLWVLDLEWNREEADPEAWSATPAPDSRVSRDWWQVSLRTTF